MPSSAVAVSSALKRMAHEAVQKAVKRGDLVRSDVCDCCGERARVQGHHADYERPLDVRWLCSRCHKNIHFGWTICHAGQA